MGQRNHSELETLTGKDDMIKERIIEALQEGWTALKDKLFENWLCQ